MRTQLSIVKSINRKKKGMEKRADQVEIYCFFAEELVTKKVARKKYFRERFYCLERCHSACKKK